MDTLRTPRVARVTFTVTAEDNVDGTATLDENNMIIQGGNVEVSITISCDTPSGFTFPLGNNTLVQCTAIDEGVVSSSPSPAQASMRDNFSFYFIAC
jgi:hypothetical protein